MISILKRYNIIKIIKENLFSITYILVIPKMTRFRKIQQLCSVIGCMQSSARHTDKWKNDRKTKFLPVGDWLHRWITRGRHGIRFRQSGKKSERLLCYLSLPYNQRKKCLQFSFQKTLLQVKILLKILWVHLYINIYMYIIGNL